MNATYNPEAILVLRDGELDDEYYDQVYKDKRIATIQQTGREVLQMAVQAPLQIGKGIVVLLSKLPEHVNNS